MSRKAFDMDISNIVTPSYCRICHQSNLEILFHWPKFPIYIWPIHLNYNQEYEDLRLYWCQDCGLLQLDLFIEEFIRKLYSQDVFGLVSVTEFPIALAKNNVFLQYCEEVLGRGWSCEEKILDIGGHDFLTSLDLEYLEGVVCDPNAPLSSPRQNLKIYQEFFSKALFEKDYFDYVILKHVLEHINDPISFMEDLCSILKQGGRLIIEVPEIKSSLAQKNYAIFYHQHIMYFDQHSLANLLKRFGFKIVDISLVGSNLRMIAQKESLSDAKETLEKDEANLLNIEEYVNFFNSYFKDCKIFLEKHCEKNKVVCYGAGGGTTLLFHKCPELVDFVECVVDSSNGKIGKNIGGTDYIVQSPEKLKEFSGRDIIINSRDFFEEIVSDIREKYIDNNFHYVRIHPLFEKKKIEK